MLGGEELCRVPTLGCSSSAILALAGISESAVMSYFICVLKHLCYYLETVEYLKWM